MHCQTSSSRCCISSALLTLLLHDSLSLVISGVKLLKIAQEEGSQGFDASALGVFRTHFTG